MVFHGLNNTLAKSEVTRVCITIIYAGGTLYKEAHNLGSRPPAP